MDGNAAPELAAQRHHFISNLWVEAASGDTLPAVDPGTGAVFAHIARGSSEDVSLAVAAAREAYGEHGDGVWGRMPAVERGRRLLRLSAAVTADAEHLAELESRSTGKPLSQGRADVTALARYLEYYAGAADKLHGETIPYQPGFTVFTQREPHGVTGHIIPWNYPLQIFGRSGGAALAAGNACVVKPAEDACISLLRVAELAAECDLPDGVLNIVTGLGHEAGAALAAHPDIDHISFTGSARTGTYVAQMAAANHTGVTLELGGKSPQIVFADADLDAAVPAIVNAIVQNAGQTCSAGSRLLVERAAYGAVLERVAECFSTLRAGLWSQDLDLGPLIRAEQRDRVLDYLATGEQDGIQQLAQGRIDDDAPAGGFFVRPTLFANVPVDHRLAQEEIFGPVLVAMSFHDEADAIRMANGTPYGLVAGVWTRDGARQLRLARALKCGQVFINNYGAGGGVELPFGGRGASGYGREKGFEALYGFTAVKTVAIRHG